MASNFCQAGFSSGHLLRVDWQSYSNTPGNYSRVDAQVKLYRNYQWNSSAAKSGYIIINGSRYNFSTTVGGSGWKTCYSVSMNVAHNANGAQTLSIQAGLNVAVTLSGVYYGMQTTSGQWALDQIYRGTTVTGWVGEPEGFKRTFDSYPIFWATAERADQLFLHINGGGRIATGYPNDGAPTYGAIWATGLSPGNTYSFQLECIKNGVTTWSPTITGSTLRPCNSCSMSGSWYYADHNPTVNISNPDRAYLHLYLYFSCNNSSGKWTDYGQVMSKPIGTVHGNYTWEFTATQRQKLYDLMSHTNSGSAILYINNFKDSGYNNMMEGWQARGDFSIRVDTSAYKPRLDTFHVSIDPTTSELLGSGSNLIQGKSTLSVTFNKSEMAAYKSASLQTLFLDYGNKREKFDLSSGSSYTYNIKNINSVGGYVLSAYVEDTRGNTSLPFSLGYNVISYKSPTLTAEVERELSSGGKIDLTLSGSFSRLVVNGVDKNELKLLTYEYIEVQRDPTPAAEPEHGGPGNLTGYTLTDDGNEVDKLLTLFRKSILILNTDKNYDFTFKIQDKLETYTVTVALVDGDPIIRILETGHVGIGKKPDTTPGLPLLQVSGGLMVDGVQMLF